MHRGGKLKGSKTRKGERGSQRRAQFLVLLSRRCSSAKPLPLPDTVRPPFSPVTGHGLLVDEDRTCIRAIRDGSKVLAYTAHSVNEIAPKRRSTMVERGGRSRV